MAITRCYSQSTMSGIRLKIAKVILPFVVVMLMMIIVFRHYNLRFVAPFTPPYESVYHHDQSVGDPGVGTGGTTENADRNSTLQDTLQRRLPRCIIIGEMKCGTRAILEYLGFHPDIAIVNEVKFFDVYYDKGLEWYRDKMPLSKPDQLTVEKSPEYYRSAYGVQRIRAMDASIKLILVVRDPVDRSVSERIQRCSKLQEANGETAVQNVTHDMCQTYESSGVLTITGAVNPHSMFIDKSMYATSLRRWTRWFPLGTQLLVVDGAKLVSDPLTEIVRVENFLGLRNYFTDEHFVFNEKKGFNCMIFEDGKKHCLGKSKGITHPDLNSHVEAKLRKFFNPFNRDFYNAVQHDFGWS